MRNDVFFVAATTLLAGVVATLICWLDSQQTYLLAQVGETSPLESAERGDGLESQPSPIDPHIDYRQADRSTIGVVTIDDVSQLARDLNSPDFTPEHDLEILHSLVDVYRRANDGRIPSGGLNEEIVDALRGRNSRRFAVLPPDLPAISATGELRDRWDTPYFFHPVSSSELEIISAGPDRKFGTADDIGKSGDDYDPSMSLAHRHR